MTRALCVNTLIFFTGARCCGNATPTVSHKVLFSIVLCIQTCLQSFHDISAVVRVVRSVLGLHSISLFGHLKELKHLLIKSYGLCVPNPSASVVACRRE